MHQNHSLYSQWENKASEDERLHLAFVSIFYKGMLNNEN
jgi:hypothetical protein